MRIRLINKPLVRTILCSLLSDIENTWLWRAERATNTPWCKVWGGDLLHRWWRTTRPDRPCRLHLWDSFPSASSLSSCEADINIVLLCMIWAGGLPDNLVGTYLLHCFLPSSYSQKGWAARASMGGLHGQSKSHWDPIFWANGVGLSFLVWLICNCFFVWTVKKVRLAPNVTFLTFSSNLLNNYLFKIAKIN